MYIIGGDPCYYRRIFATIKVSSHALRQSGTSAHPLTCKNMRLDRALFYFLSQDDNDVSNSLKLMDAKLETHNQNYCYELDVRFINTNYRKLLCSNFCVHLTSATQNMIILIIKRVCLVNRALCELTISSTAH